MDRLDEALRRLLIEDPHEGWTVFVDTYTPTLLAIIERSGVADRDDVLDVYVRVCERLAARDCEQLRRFDPARGALAAWLTAVIGRAVVDWLRTRRGRRRLFTAIRRLERFDQQVFELYYWGQQRIGEVVEALSRGLGRMVSHEEVLDALDRVHQALSDRNRAQLAALMARAGRVESLDDREGGAAADPVEPRHDPEAALHARQIESAWNAALGELPHEEAAIVRMIFGHGWARHEVQRALHLDSLTSARVRQILERLRALFARRGVGPGEAAASGLTFLAGKTT